MGYGGTGPRDLATGSTRGVGFGAGSNLPERELAHRGDKPLTGTVGTGRAVGGDLEERMLRDRETVPGQTQPHSTTGQTHYGRDAALGGAGAAGVAEYEHHKHRDDPSHLSKEAEKEQKHHDKLLAKEEKREEKAERKYEKEVEKDEKHHEKKSGGGLLGFLHRDKKDKHHDDVDETSKTHHGHHGKEAAGVAAVGGAAAYEEDKHHHERNRLHKDPPPGYTNTPYADAPKGGYASQVTGGTGTTALAQGTPLPGGSHISSAGNTLDPAVANTGDTQVPGGAHAYGIGSDHTEGNTSGYASQVTGGTGTTQLAGLSDEVTDPSQRSVGGSGYGQSSLERETVDTDPSNRLHDPARMGYSGTGSRNL